jgi:NAD(P)-dependent dehydrogenase (short-subunit alcohol dehydrogenase family)
MSRIALVTGAAGGLGRAIAGRLAALGHVVVMADIDGPGAERAAAALAGAHAMTLDVADEADVARGYAELDRRFGRLDILVNNAGIMGAGAPLETMSLAGWERTLKVNLSGPFLMCRGAVPLMRRGGWGRIVNISSRAARTRSAVGDPAYPASKSALIGLSRVLANEAGVDGITVNCVAPATVETAMTQGRDGDYFAHRAAETALGRIGTPEDVAAAVAFLCGEAAGFVTGAVLDVNGGSFMP